MKQSKESQGNKQPENKKKTMTEKIQYRSYVFLSHVYAASGERKAVASLMLK